MKKIFIALSFLPLFGTAQVSITGSGTYSQDFNTLAATGTAITWMDNTTIASWYAQRSGTGSGYNASNGGSNSGALYSFGLDADRALGTVGSNTPQNFAIGVQLKNDAVTNVAGITVSYTMEQWRDGGNTTAQTLSFYYKKSSTLITALNPNSFTGWTAVTALNGTSTINTAVASALDGNLPANKVSIVDVELPGVILLPGEFIMLKWDDPNNAGNDHGLSVDDLSIDYTLTCQTSSFLTETACDSYNLNGTIYSTSNTYVQVLPNANYLGCDSTITLNLTVENSIVYYPDVDLDGFGSLTGGINSCVVPVGYVLNNTDCDDNNNTIYPGATDVCDGFDNDCDGFVDELSDITFYADTDQDGFGDPTNTTLACVPPLGYVTTAGDCDDDNDMIYPGATELCNGIDDDCDGTVDEDVLTMYYLDNDSDGYGDISNFVWNCSQPLGYVTVSGDCDDSDAGINPGEIDIPFDAVDQDCSGSDATSYPQIATYQFEGATSCPNENPNVTAQPTDAIFSSYLSIGTTCAATNNVFNNSNWNTTTTVDLSEYNEFTITANDCKTMDLGSLSFDHRNSSGNMTFYVRSSIDGYTADLGTGVSSSTLTNFSLNLGTEFSDLGTVTFRFYITEAAAAGTTWRQDNVTVTGLFNTIAPTTFYMDFDSDGYGDASTTISACNTPDGYVSNSNDCNDTDATINPTTVWYQDADSDNYGNAAMTTTSCIQPVGYVLNDEDCDDNDDLVGIASLEFYIDNDNDGYGIGIAQIFCSDPGTGYASLDGDCDDNSDAINPGQVEICDGLDNDCSGTADDGLTFTNYYLDADDDGFGSENPISACASPGSSYVTISGDCDDSDAFTFPGATDIADDQVDQNCDGIDGYVGLAEDGIVLLSVSPNPSTGMMTISRNGIEQATISVIDVNGKVFATFEMLSSSIELNLSSLNSGMYILKMMTNSTSAQERIVIQH